MRADEGFPEIGDVAGALGVRVPTDIRPDSTGQVRPGSGGMSVSPSLQCLPARLVPERLRELVPGAIGRNDQHVWAMGEGSFMNGPLTTDLVLRRDPKKASHGFVEPSQQMSLEEYRAAISGTRKLWTIDEEEQAQ